MTDAQKQRDIYARTPDGGTQLAASTDRWHLFDDHVHLAPTGRTIRGCDGSMPS